MKKKIGIVIALIVVGIATYLFFAKAPEEVIKESPVELTGTAFQKIEIDYSPSWDENSDFFFSGAAVIDINNDGKSEVFVANGSKNSDALLTLENGKLVNIAEQSGIAVNLDAKSASYGANSIDIDNDGDTDLVVSRQDGIYVLVNDNGKFSETKLDIPLKPDTAPLGVTLADIDNDGLVDMYVSMFVAPSKFRSSVFNDPEHAKTNLMLKNNGNLNFTDVTEQTGTAGSQNTFTSSFVDLNNDGKQDLILSNNTGKVEIFKNNGNLNFELVDGLPRGDKFGYWMGIGVGDMDADGDQDLFFSNIGSSISKDLTQGDLANIDDLDLEWKILENQGNFKFKDITQETKLDGYGFAWGGTFEDLNADGKLDLLVAQNYIKWPLHKLQKMPGKSFTQVDVDGNMEFYQNGNIAIPDTFYGQSPLIVDLNNDNKPDVMWINMAEKPVAYLNTTDTNYIKLITPDNSQHIGLDVTLAGEDNQSYTKQLNDQVGLLTDQTHDVFFAIGDDKTGIINVINNVSGEVYSVDVNNDGVGYFDLDEQVSTETPAVESVVVDSVVVEETEQAPAK